MKYILILLVSFAFAQETKDTTLTEYTIQPIESQPLLDFTLQTPATECFQILIEFQEGWVENMLNLKDTILCPNMIDVRIEYEGIIKDYTMDEFLKRLGFIEWLKK